MQNTATPTQTELPGLPPGVGTEVSPAEAERMGMFDETALSLADAIAAAEGDATEDRNHG